MAHIGTGKAFPQEPHRWEEGMIPEVARALLIHTSCFKAVALLGLLLVTISCGGGGAGSSVAPPPATPRVTSFQPTSGPVGTSVTVTGSNLTGASAVSVNGTSAVFAVNSSTQITATVPNGATTGKIAVTTPNGSAMSASNFTVTSPAPTISSFNPASGPVGTPVTVTGTNFTGATAVAFNGTAASFTVNSGTQIATSVPVGATTGKISVTTADGTANSANSFTVTLPAPTITGFNPASGQVGTGVTVSGTNFTGATGVMFNSTAAAFSVNSSAQITTSVPAGATTGKISVTTPGGSAMSAGNFTVTSSSGTLDLTIDGLYVTQATQDYPGANVPLVENRSAWVRVFARANQANSVAPVVRVQFTNGATTNTLNIAATVSSVPTSIDANTLNSWNASVPAGWIQPGVQITATVDPTGAIPEADENNNQFSQTPDVRTLQPWRVTLVPVHTVDGRTGVVENATRDRDDWVNFAKRLHPVPDAVDVTVSATMNSSVNTLSSSGGSSWSTVLSEVSAKRTADGPAGANRYYYGVVKVGYTSGVAGLGYIGFPVAIGWDYSSGPSVLAHEEGHNFNRRHSPCGNPSNIDPNYPYAGGVIGVTGWDAFATSNNLKPSATYTDVMAYCSTQWTSDYTYTGVLNFRENSSFGFVAPPVAGAAQEGLLVWGRIENGQTILEPAFRVPATGAAPQTGAYTWEARDALGQVLAQVAFDAPEVADLPDTSLRIFSFVVPMTSDTVDKIRSLRLSEGSQELARSVQTGAVPAVEKVHVQALPNRRVQLSWNAAAYPVLMLRDARTREVRGFVRGGNAVVADAPEELEVNLSDRVRSERVRYRRVLE